MITISGLHGAGKSTYAKQLAQEFGLEHISAGGLFREIAKEKGMTLVELTSLAGRDDSLDRMIDERTQRWAERGSVVLDALLAGWMTREHATIKIHMVAPEGVRITRIANRDNISLEEARRRTLMRERCEKLRFKRMYGIEVDDLSIYDLVLNTSLLPIESNVKLLKEIVREYLRTRREAIDSASGRDRKNMR